MSDTTPVVVEGESEVEHLSHSLSPKARAIAMIPAAVALLFFVAFSAIVLSQPEKMIEPDPYAYRASIAALENGNLTLTQDQYDALSTSLQQSPLGGGIMQWHQNADGSWVSEKNPGYPFLAIGFDEVGALRLAPLFYGALACLAMWFGARRWLGRWGGTFAVGAYCSTALAMVMAWRSTMPTFTDASLVAVGLGLLIWSVVAVERAVRRRTIIGALAFFAFGLAVFVRYTNVTVLAVAAAFALVVCLRLKWRLGWKTLLWWVAASLPPLIASLAYNSAVFDGPFSTGYNASTVQFSLSAIPENLRLMPSRLWQSMPIFVIGLLAIVVLIILQIVQAIRARSKDTAVASAESVLTANESEFELAPSDELTPGAVDRWIGTFLVLAWAATWLTYSAYEWTANFGGGRNSGSLSLGGPAGGGMPGFSGIGGMTQPVYSTVRFYLPALGAIALLVAWLFTRLPAVVGILALIALFALGAHEFIDTVNSSWASMPMGGGRGSIVEPGGGSGPMGAPNTDPRYGPGGGGPFGNGQGGTRPALPNGSPIAPPQSGPTG